MPTRAPGPCSYPGCPNPGGDDSRCPAHPREGRWASGATTYTKRPGWTATRGRVLRRDHHLCTCGAAATEVHHLVPGVEEDWALISKCGPCHRALTQAEATAARLARPRG